mgnify:CR=1 FL=1
MLEFIKLLFKKEDNTNKIINNLILDKLSNLEVYLKHNDNDIKDLIKILKENVNDVSNNKNLLDSTTRIFINFVKKQVKRNKLIDELYIENNKLNVKVEELEKRIELLYSYILEKK